MIEIELEKSLLIFESESFLNIYLLFLSFIYYQFLQHLTWILGLKPSAGGTLKAMPASEAPNVVRNKSYINCFVKIESFYGGSCGECANARVSSAQDLRKQTNKTNMTVHVLFCFFSLGSFCLAFVLLRLCVQELSQLISSVLLSW